MNTNGRHGRFVAWPPLHANLATCASLATSAIASEFNARRIPAARGGTWSVVSVSRPGPEAQP
jgi:hypothetical protein